MPRLPDRATAEEARAAAGYTEMEWRSFIGITNEVAREMLKRTQDARWQHMPYDEKCEAMERINTTLAKQGIATVEINVVGWRMSKAIGNVKCAGKSTAKVSPPTATPRVEPASVIAENGSGAAIRIRPFDPIRDI